MNLKKLKELNNSDNLIFSFITSDDKEYLISSLDEFMKNIKNDSIILGKQFYENGCLEFNNTVHTDQFDKYISKSQKIINYLDELGKNNNIVMSFFADDNLFDYKILEYEQKKMLTKKIELLYVEPKGINNLNEQLEEYICINKRKTI